MSSEKKVLLSKDPYGVRGRMHLHFGNAIFWVREGLFLTQDDFAAILEGVSQPNLARYEEGKVEPKLDFWRKFARTFGVNLTWAICGGADPYVGGLFGASELGRLQDRIIDLSNKNRLNHKVRNNDDLLSFLMLIDWRNAARKAEKEAEEEAARDPYKKIQLSDLVGLPERRVRATENVRDAASRKPKPPKRRRAGGDA